MLLGRKDDRARNAQISTPPKSGCMVRGMRIEQSHTKVIHSLSLTLTAKGERHERVFEKSDLVIKIPVVLTPPRHREIPPTWL